MRKQFTEKEYYSETIDGELHRIWLFTNDRQRTAILVEFVYDGELYTPSEPEEVLFSFPDGVQKRLDREYEKGRNSIVQLSMMPGTTPDCVIIQNAFAEKIEDARKMIKKPFPYKYVLMDADHPEQWEKIER